MGVTDLLPFPNVFFHNVELIIINTKGVSWEYVNFQIIILLEMI